MDNTTPYRTELAEETQNLGASVGVSLIKGKGSPKVICCYGELGSGKTTFVQGLARGLGITDRLISPTFIIVRRYRIPDSQGFLYHIDAYRVNGPEEADTFGFSDILKEPDSVVVIEWPERLGTALPHNRLDIRFQTCTDGSHEITVT